MKLRVSHKGHVISGNIQVADNFVKKLVGFMFSPEPKDDYGILFYTNSIQTHFMRFNLDVVFMDKSNRIVKIIRGLKPWRITRFYSRANRTLELPAGRLPSHLQEGDVLEVENV